MSRGLAPLCANCGRFLRRPRALSDGETLTDVRGDCSRCGPNQPLYVEGDHAIWLAWDSWKWDEP